MPACASCGAEIGSEHAFCDMCGARVVPPATPQPLASTQRRKRRWPIVVAVLVAVFVLLGACAAGSVLLVLPWFTGGRLVENTSIQDGTPMATVEVPDGYTFAAYQSHDDPDFGPEAADSARILMLTPTGDAAPPGIVCAVICWWEAPSEEDAIDLGRQLDGEWSYSDDVWDDLAGLIPEESEDVWMHWESRPEQSVAVHAEIWLSPDSGMSEDEREDEATRLALWALKNAP